jgi:hypothetical protein
MCVSHVLEKNFFIRMRCCKTTATASVWLSVRLLPLRLCDTNKQKCPFIQKKSNILLGTTNRQSVCTLETTEILRLVSSSLFNPIGSPLDKMCDNCTFAHASQFRLREGVVL